MQTMRASAQRRKKDFNDRRFGPDYADPRSDHGPPLRPSREIDLSSIPSITGPPPQVYWNAGKERCTYIISTTRRERGVCSLSFILSIKWYHPSVSRNLTAVASSLSVTCVQ